MRDCVQEDFDKFGHSLSYDKKFYLCIDDFEKFYVQGDSNGNKSFIYIVAGLNENYSNSNDVTQLKVIEWLQEQTFFFSFSKQIVNFKKDKPINQIVNWETVIHM